VGSGVGDGGGFDVAGLDEGAVDEGEGLGRGWGLGPARTGAEALGDAPGEPKLAVTRPKMMPPARATPASRAAIGRLTGTG
jgi:hypothetical protein